MSTEGLTKDRAGPITRVRRWIRRRLPGADNHNKEDNVPGTKEKKAVNPEVMEMVEAAIRQNPDAENKELYEQATEVDESIEDLSLRQFHARYPLQVKRRMAQARRESENGDQPASSDSEEATTETTSEADRDAIRDALLDYAREVAEAETKVEIIDVTMKQTDSYVDRLCRLLDG